MLSGAVAAQPDRGPAFRRRIVVIEPLQRVEDRAQRHRIAVAWREAQPRLLLDGIGVGRP